MGHAKDQGNYIYDFTFLGFPGPACNRFEASINTLSHNDHVKEYAEEASLPVNYLKMNAEQAVITVAMEQPVSPTRGEEIDAR